MTRLQEVGAAGQGTVRHMSPRRTTTRRLYIPAFVPIEQTRYNVLITEA